MANFLPFGEAGLFDEFLQNLDVAAFETPLLRVGKIVRWEQFEPELHAAVRPAPPKGPGGRPRFAPLLMFKVLVLQSLHGLADDAVSYQITDRNSFRAFLGLTPGDAVPDGQTIADFRAALGAAGSFQRLFEGFLLHLQQCHTGWGWPKRGSSSMPPLWKCRGSATPAQKTRRSKPGKSHPPLRKMPSYARTRTPTPAGC